MKKKVFNFKEQKLFSELSEDYNPIHLDEDWAANEYPGEIVIYGISILLWAIESCTHENQIERIKGKFIHPIFLGDSLVCKYEKDELNLKLFLYIENTLVSKFEIYYGKKFLTNKAINPLKKEILSTPKVLSAKEIEFQEGIVEISKYNFSKIKSIYPNSAKYLGVVGIQGLLSTSRLVGMYCPGLRSIFSDFDFFFESNQKLVNFKVIKINPILGFAKLKVNGLNLKGEIGAYFTEKIVEKNFEISNQSSKKYTNSCALIIGGSGLGKLATNILLEEGAEVFMTSRLKINEKNNFNDLKKYKKFLHIPLDLNDTSSIDKFLNKLNKPIKSLYYFASPRIFRRRLKSISSEDMTDFLNIYVYKYINLVELLLKEKKCSKDLVIGYPSTIAINEKFPDQFEYYSAKKIGEFACDLLKKKHKNINIKIERLPRLNTRQTNSFIKAKTFDNKEEIEKFIYKVEKSIE